MTALNWDLNPNHILILSDSLAISGEDHLPALMTTKVYPLPHLGICIAGTGIQPLAETFWSHANSKCVSSDITHLDEYAPDIIRQIWEDLFSSADYAAEDLSNITGTVYCFGWCIESASFTGYVYRSTNNFASEQLRHGTAAKPKPASGKLPPIHGLVDFINLLRAQKDEDRARPIEKRVGIGGDVILTLMERSEIGFTSISQQPVLRFEDYDDDWEIILSKLPDNSEHPLAHAILARGH